MGHLPAESFREAGGDNVLGRLALSMLAVSLRGCSWMYGGVGNDSGRRVPIVKLSALDCLASFVLVGEAKGQTIPSGALRPVMGRPGDNAAGVRGAASEASTCPLMPSIPESKPAEGRVPLIALQASMPFAIVDLFS